MGLKAAFKFVTSGFRWTIRQTQRLINYLTPKPDVDPQELSPRNPLNNIPILYGRGWLTGNKVFIQSQYVSNLDTVVALCEGPISSTEGRIMVNDKPHTDPDHASLIDTEFYVGTSTQAASPLLISRQSEWTSDHKLLAIAHRYFRFRYHDEHMAGDPNLRIEQYGMLCWDTRTSQFLWSDNPILHILDYCLSPIYGFGMSLLDFDTTNINEMANYCDSLGEDGRKRFTSNILIQSSKSREKNIELLLEVCRASWYIQNEKIFFSINRTQSTSLSLNDDDIVSFSLTQEKADKVWNTGELSFTNIDDEKKTVSYVNLGALQSDQQIESKYNGSAQWIKSYDEAMDYLAFQVDTSRRILNGQILVSMKAFSVIQNDILSISYGEFGMQNKLWRVAEAVFEEKDLLVSLSIVEYFADDYIQQTHPVNTDSLPVYQFNNQKLLSAPSSLVLLNNDSIHAENNTRESALVFSWDAVDGFAVNGYEVQFKLSSSALFINASNVTNSNISINYPLRSGEIYDYRVRTLSQGGSIKSEWTTITQVYQPLSVPSPPQTPGTLSIKGEGSSTEFYGPDCTITWDWLNNQGTPILGSVTGSSPSAYFQLQVLLLNNVVLRTEELYSNDYTYSQSKNAADQLEIGSSDVIRDFKFRLLQRDAYGQLSPSYSELIVSNPHPDPSTVIFSLTAGNKIIKINILQHNREKDLSHYACYLSTSADPPLAQTYIGKILPNENTLFLRYYAEQALVNGQLYHIQLVPVDTFSLDLTNNTPIQTITPQENNGFADELQAFDEISLGSSTFRDTGMQVKRNPFNNGLPGLFLGDVSKKQFIEFSDENGDAKFIVGDNVLQNGVSGFNKSNDSIYNNWDQNLNNISEDQLSNNGSFSFQNGYCSLQNGLNSGDLRSHYKQLFGVPVSWANSRRVRYVIKPSLSGTGTGNVFSFLTGRDVNLLGNGAGVFFGFKYFNSGDLRAVYNDGTNNYQSASLTTLSTLNIYTIEAHSDVDEGTIKWYINDLLMHTVNVNTSIDFLPTTYDERMWHISLIHQGTSTGNQEVFVYSIEFQQISNS